MSFISYIFANNNQRLAKVLELDNQHNKQQPLFYGAITQVNLR